MQILAAPSRWEINQAHKKSLAQHWSSQCKKPLVCEETKIMWRDNPWNIFSITALIISHFLHLCQMQCKRNLLNSHGIHCSSWNWAFFALIPMAAIPRAVIINDFLTERSNWTVSNPLEHAAWFQALAPPEEGPLNRSLIYSLHSAATNITHLNTQQYIMQNIDPINAKGSLIVVAKNMLFRANNGSSSIKRWISQ